MSQRGFLMSKISIVVILSFLFLFSTVFTGKARAVSCSCDFDTEKYSAIAEGEGYCSATTKEGKHCTVVFNGNVKKTAMVERSSVYGPFDKYVSHLEAINREIRSATPVVLMSESKWVLTNLPLMIRSSYAAAPFIDHKERETLDITLKDLFWKFDKQIFGAISGYSPVWEKNFIAEKGKFEFIVKDISVRFAIFTYP